MSLQVLTQGGAGGASASIQVNGLSETDSVKAVQKINKVIENPEYKEYRVLKGQSALGDVAVGETVKLNVNGTATEFIVVHQGLPSSMYDSSCDGTWLLMKDVYESGAWHSGGNVNNYSASTIHSYLNSTFFGLLDEDMQSVVVQAKIPYVNGRGSSGSVASGAAGLSAKVFLLSGYEVGFITSDSSYLPVDGTALSYFSGSGDSNSNRIGYLDGTAKSWWLRSPYTNSVQQAFSVSSSGGCTYYYCSLGSSSYGIRPAMILPTNLSVKDGFIDGTEVQPGKLLSSASVGDIVKMNVGGTPTEFIVVQQGKPSSLYDDSCNGTWLLMKDIHNTAMYNIIGNASYDTAMIRNSLSIFTGKLDENVLNAVKTVKIPYLEIEGAKNDIKRTLFSGTEGLSTKAFLLSVYEVDPSRTGSPKDGTCLDYFKSASTSDRIASFEGTTTAWWTRTGWGTYADTQSYLVGDNGSTSTTSVKTYYGVRPAIILPGDTIITDDFIGGSVSEPSSVETYTPLEYIESTGTQIINTNYIVASNTRVGFKAMVLENQPQTYPALFGVHETASGGNRFGINSSWAARTGDTAFGPNANLFNVAREGSLENGVFILDGTTYTSTETFTPLDIPMYLFSINDLENQPTRAALNSAARFYYFKIYESDVLVRNFVPAKRNSDGVIGLFDTVNSVFYTNAGTGDFVAGPEVSQYIEAVVDGKTVTGKWVEAINPEYEELFVNKPIKEYNLITNGNFSNNTEGWTMSSNYDLYFNDVDYLRLEATQTASSGTYACYQELSESISGNTIETRQVLYAMAKVRGNSANTSYPRVYLSSYKNGEPSAVYNNLEEINGFVGVELNDGEWHTVSEYVETYDETDGDYNEYYRIAFGISTTTSGDIMDIKEVMLFNLTAIYGVGNEPTKEWCDANIAIDAGNIYSTPLGSLAVGATVYLNVDGTATEFIVVQQGKPSGAYDDSTNGTWLLMKDIYEERAWHSSKVSAYGDSTIHKYLNSTFLGLLDEDMQSAVIEAEIPRKLSGSDDISAKVFLLSVYELGLTTSDNQNFIVDGAKLSYFESGTDTSAEDKRIAYMEGTAARWWLRSKSSTDSEMTWYSSVYGSIGCYYPTSTYGIRPAMILPTNLKVVDGFIDGSVEASSGSSVMVKELYTPLKYIESTGTQYIDTGYKPNTNTKIEIGAYTTDTTNDKPLFGVRKSNGVDGFLCWFNPQVAEQPGFAVGSMSNTYTSYGIATGVRYDVTLSNSLFTMNELSYPFDAQTFTSSYNLYLLALNKADVLDDRLFYGRLYYTRIYESDVLVRDYVPVKRVSDGAIGLYDRVSQTFYANAGTGKFIAGPEVPESSSYFLISPIKAYGTWEVRAVSVVNKMQVIDAATKYEISMEPVVSTLYLYKAGDKCVDITGGWDIVHSGSTAQVAWNTDNVVLSQADGTYSGSYRTLIFTTNAIDLSQYSKVCFDMSVVDGRTSNNLDHVHFGAASAKAVTTFQDTVDGVIEYEGNVASGSNISTDRKIFYVDIANCTDTLYIGIHNYNMVTTTIYNIWLE